MKRIVVVGEGMLELSQANGLWSLGHGGDTLNTAIHLARFGQDVAYASALGADQFSTGLRAAWAAEGLDVSLILTDLPAETRVICYHHRSTWGAQLHLLARR